MLMEFLSLQPWLVETEAWRVQSKQAAVLPSFFLSPSLRDYLETSSSVS